MKADFEKSISQIKKHYDGLALKHGAAPQAAQWRDHDTQSIRIKRLLEIGDVHNKSILDFGCGSAVMLDILKAEGFCGVYTGLDISDEALKTAQDKHPESTFLNLNIFEQELDQEYDFILASGTFNNRLENNWKYFTTALDILFKRARIGLGFNLLTTYVDWEEKSLWYASPEKVFSHCKSELSPLVSLRHDYLVKKDSIPFEFMTFIYKKEL